MPVRIADVLQWAQIFEESDRSVKRTEIGDKILVSTIFTGIDYGYPFGQPGYKPLLFETMVFGGPLDHYQERYSTWIGAEYGHDKIVAKIHEKLLEAK